MTGGGVSIRNRVMNSKLATISLPKFDAGCGGIDIYAGGFSFINDKQLIQTMKSMGSSAVGYSFLLGLEATLPQVANTLKQLQTWANNINSLNINSCELASQMVGSVWPQRTLASQQICRTLSSQKGSFHDFVAARHKCSQSSEYENIMQSIDADPIYQDTLGDEFNLAWEAIQKQNLLAQNKELSELFISLLGTIIVRKGDEIHIETWPSKINDESFLRVMMEGGDTTIYACTPDGKNQCLVMQEQHFIVRPEQSWLGRIRVLLESMQNNILNDQELNDAEKELLNKSHLPLYKIVNVLTAYKKGHCPIDLIQVADIVAMDLLIQYLSEVVNLVREGVNHLRKSQFYAEPIDDYLRELDRVERTIRYYETRSMNLFEREFQMMQKIQILEDQIASEIILG
jgi:conjugative transfer pilus assembly protein TraH